MQFIVNGISLDGYFVEGINCSQGRIIWENMRVWKNLIATAIFLFFSPLLCVEFQLKVSQLNGKDIPSCLLPNATIPCKSLEYVLADLKHSTKFQDQNSFYSIMMLDRTYIIEKQLKISQPVENVSLSIESEKGRKTAIYCNGPEAGVTIGSQFLPVPIIVATNIHFTRISFEACGPKHGAAVLVWNSRNITFRSCSFRNNTNAGLNVFDSTVNIDRCVFANNTSNVKTRQMVFQPGVSSAGAGLGVMFIHGVNRTVIVTRSKFISNTALFNNTDYYVSPSSNLSTFYNTGGGVLVAFLYIAKQNYFLLQNSTVVTNSATYGGGVFTSYSESASDNTAILTQVIWRENRGAQSGGGISVSEWDSSKRSTTIIRDSIVTENWARRGGGVSTFFMNKLETPGGSTLKFERVRFYSNTGHGSTAVLLSSALPLGYPIASIPEFTNCSITEHVRRDKTSTSVSSPFTSFRVDIRFKGHNIFARNRESGAIRVKNSIIHVEGKLEVRNNTGYMGGGMWLSLSQIKLYPHSELLFVGNTAASNGGALCVDTFTVHEVINEYNTGCFLTYRSLNGYENVPASSWKVRTKTCY